MFDVKKTRRDMTEWIRSWFMENGKDCTAVIGISGGKDSSVVAALCVEALERHRVLGVLMPNGEQSDIDCARRLVTHLGIESYTVNLRAAYEAVLASLPTALAISQQTLINLPPRLRMTTLYAISQSRNGRVANTCNLSENWVGYSTRYGDDTGDFSPLGKLTVTEVVALGEELGLPSELVHKAPSDGLTGKTDEDNLGFSYAVLDRYIREGVCEDADTRERIDRLNKLNSFKLKTIPCFEP